MKSIKKSIIFIILIFIIFTILLTNVSFAATDQVGLFRSSETSDSNALNIASSAINSIYSKLGYSIVTNSPATITNSKNPVLSYINGNGKNYGFSIICHGNGNDTISRLNVNRATSGADAIYPDNITGNWHLVILNSCQSLSNPSFANAFKTTSAYSNRAILGWFNEVEFEALKEFWPHFYNKVGTMGLRDLALDAASKCSSSTPIRFYGDTSWYGWAW